MGEDKEKEMYLNTCLEEYKTLREEVRQASINMIASLSIGLGVAIFLALASINLYIDDSPFSYGDMFFLLCVFCIILPLLIGLIITLWLGELARFKRAGNYICFIERKISMLFKDFFEKNIEGEWKSIQRSLETKLGISKNDSDLSKPLQWETWLRSFKEDRFFSTSGHMKWIYIMRLAILVTSFVLVWIVGVILFIINFDKIENIGFLILLLISLGATALSFIYLMNIARKLGEKQILNSDD